MILVKPSYTIESFPINATTTLERYGRVCYKSEERITGDSAGRFCKMLFGRDHLSVIEHLSATVRFVVDRGVSHELVRHRLCSFSQESTRYCNYAGGVTFVIPPWIGIEPGSYCATVHTDENRINFSQLAFAERNWYEAVSNAELWYQRLLNEGWTPQQARSVLPNSLKTEIVVTANLREWLHIFKLRCDQSAHPQMREVMVPLCGEFGDLLPELFG